MDCSGDRVAEEVGGGPEEGQAGAKTRAPTGGPIGARRYGNEEDY